MKPTMPTVVLMTLLCGCSTTATISRLNGAPVEAKIHRSDSRALYVKTEGGPDVVLPRSEVSDIDHPGNAAAVVGGLLTAYGGLNIAAGLGTCAEQGGAYCVGTFLPAAIGLPVLLWGLNTWSQSTSAAASNFPPAHAQSVPVPPDASPFDFSSGSRAEYSAP